MATTGLRIGIVGCGAAAKAHVDRLLAVEGVSIVGCADAEPALARTLASSIPSPIDPVPAFEDHSELLRQASPDALVISSPDRSHYRPAMDGLQAGCHLFLVGPPSTNVQEVVDMVGLARARDLRVGVGHGSRDMATLGRARELLAAGTIGRFRLVTGTLALNWPKTPGVSGDAGQDNLRSSGGILAVLGFELIDALIWTTGRPAEMVSAIQSLDEDGLDVVTAASIRLGDGINASIAISGVADPPTFELVYYGEKGRLRANGPSLVLEGAGDDPREILLGSPDVDLAANFVAAVREGAALCCPASEALDAVRVLEAIARSATIGQFVGLA